MITKHAKFPNALGEKISIYMMPYIPTYTFCKYPNIAMNIHT